MSIRTWIARQWLRRELQRLERQGPVGKWVLENKAKVGGLLVLAVQGLRLFPDVIPHSVIEGLSLVAAVFGGSGMLPSDEAVKEYGASAK